MAYAIEFTHQAEEDLAHLDKTIAQQIANRIDWLSKYDIH
jgi:mRNA-degrading endonuclease RelE of RelBE toxin-antitoxin system